MPKSLDISPLKSVAEEVDLLRKSLRECVEAYVGRLDTDLLQIREVILAQSKKPGTHRLHDMRDMITLCRTVDLKPEKGRRKDLKKIESLIEDMQSMLKTWNNY
ncbi:MAG: hypothetical protein JO076_10925 [Verrucomicrobia bacterium]|nr:hypothetical protein [Verrucomicrobiota bacterium]